MVTLAHISDLHLSREHRRANLRNARRLLDAVAREKVDHLVLTGDVVSNPDELDYDLARSLLARHGYLRADRLSVVPGNHDIFGGVNTPEEILHFPHRCRTAKYATQVEGFVRHFHEAFEGCLFAAQDHPFPFAKTLGDLMLIGVNSVAGYSGMWNPLGSNGKVDEEQRFLLETLLSAGLFRDKRKIVLVHHHFCKPVTSRPGAMYGIWGLVERYTMKLWGQTRLLDLFRAHGVELVMHGHVHESVHEYRQRGVRLLNAGGSILGPHTPALRWHLLRITENGISIETREVPGEDSRGLPIGGGANELQEVA